MALQTVPATISAPVAALTADSPIGTILEATIPLVSLYQSGYDTYALFETIFPLAENRLSVESDALEAAIILKMCTACGVTLKQTVMDVLANLDPAQYGAWLGNNGNIEKYGQHLADVTSVLATAGLTNELLSQYQALTVGLNTDGATPANTRRYTLLREVTENCRKNAVGVAEMAKRLSDMQSALDTKFAEKSQYLTDSNYLPFFPQHVSRINETVRQVASSPNIGLIINDPTAFNLCVQNNTEYFVAFALEYPVVQANAGTLFKKLLVNSITAKAILGNEKFIRYIIWNDELDTVFNAHTFTDAEMELLKETARNYFTTAQTSKWGSNTEQLTIGPVNTTRAEARYLTFIGSPIDVVFGGKTIRRNTKYKKYYMHKGVPLVSASEYTIGEAGKVTAVNYSSNSGNISDTYTYSPGFSSLKKVYVTDDAVIGLNKRRKQIQISTYVEDVFIAYPYYYCNLENISVPGLLALLDDEQEIDIFHRTVYQSSYSKTTSSYTLAAIGSNTIHWVSNNNIGVVTLPLPNGVTIKRLLYEYEGRAAILGSNNCVYMFEGTTLKSQRLVPPGTEVTVVHGYKRARNTADGSKINTSTFYVNSLIEGNQLIHLYYDVNTNDLNYVSDPSVTLSNGPHSGYRVIVNEDTYDSTVEAATYHNHLAFAIKDMRTGLLVHFLPGVDGTSRTTQLTQGYDDTEYIFVSGSTIFYSTGLDNIVKMFSYASNLTTHVVTQNTLDEPTKISAVLCTGDNAADITEHCVVVGDKIYYVKVATSRTSAEWTFKVRNSEIIKVSGWQSTMGTADWSVRSINYLYGLEGTYTQRTSKLSIRDGSSINTQLEVIYPFSNSADTRYIWVYRQHPEFRDVVYSGFTTVQGNTSYTGAPLAVRSCVVPEPPQTPLIP